MIRGIKKKIKHKIIGFLRRHLVSDLSVQMGGIQITQDFMFRHMNTKDFPIRVVFLIRNVRVWDALHLVYEELVKDPLFEVIVILLYDQTPGDADFEKMNQEALAYGKAELERMNISYITLGNSQSDLLFLKNLVPQIIFLQYPWSGANFHTYDAINLQFARLCYIPYALSIIKLEYEDFWQLLISRLGWMLFLPQSIKDSATLDYYRSSLSPIYISGYPKFERIAKSSSVWPIINSQRKFRILWSPHHSVDKDPRSFGTFLDNYRSFFIFAKDHPEIEIVLSMHPILLERISLFWGKSLYDDILIFLEEWQSLTNTGISEESDCGGIFHASDLLITDGISWLMDYQLMKKPIIFIERERHSPFNALGVEMIKAVHAYPSFELAVDKILYFAQGGVDDKASLMEEHAKMIYQESAAYDIKEAIKKKYLGELASKKL